MYFTCKVYILNFRTTCKTVKFFNIFLLGFLHIAIGKTYILNAPFKPQPKGDEKILFGGGYDDLILCHFEGLLGQVMPATS